MNTLIGKEIKISTLREMTNNKKTLHTEIRYLGILIYSRSAKNEFVDNRFGLKLDQEYKYQSYQQSNITKYYIIEENGGK